MHFGFTFLASLAILLLAAVSTDASTKPKSGRLRLEVNYSNPKDREAKGDFCDPGFKECEVYFVICLSKINSKHNCEYLNESTQPRAGTIIQKIFSRDIYEGTSEKTNLLISVFDHDDFSTHDLIGNFTKSAISLTHGSKIETKMFREAPPEGKPGADVKITMSVECNKDYYGSFCSIHCVPDNYAYTCNEDGSRKCNPGFKGELCNDPDPCALEKCADHAECRPDPEQPTKRKCYCNNSGLEAAECYPDYNPCESQPCKNGGACRVIGRFRETFACDCPQLFYGLRCSIRKSACLERAKEISRNKYNLTAEFDIPEKELEPVCLNNGQCLEKTNDFQWFCKCEDNWIGETCNEEANKYNYLTMFLIIGFILLLLLVGILLYFLIKHRKKVKLERQRALLNSTTRSQVYYIGENNEIYPALIPTDYLLRDSIYHFKKRQSPQVTVYEDLNRPNDVYESATVYDNRNSLNVNPDRVNMLEALKAKPNRNLPDIPT